jgi:hypothetical protein
VWGCVWYTFMRLYYRFVVSVNINLLFCFYYGQSMQLVSSILNGHQNFRIHLYIKNFLIVLFITLILCLLSNSICLYSWSFYLCGSFIFSQILIILTSDIRVNIHLLEYAMKCHCLPLTISLHSALASLNSKLISSLLARMNETLIVTINSWIVRIVVHEKNMFLLSSQFKGFSIC